MAYLLILKCSKNIQIFIQCKARQRDEISFRHYYYSSKAQSETIRLVCIVTDNMPHMIVSDGMVSPLYEHVHELDLHMN
jgi:hypothetical protein